LTLERGAPTAQRRRCGVAGQLGAFRVHELPDCLLGRNSGMAGRADAYVFVDEQALVRANVAVDVGRDMRID
jgi:hypothetical protein